MAGIIASDYLANTGIAPEARIIAVKVFGNHTPNNVTEGSTGTILQALGWVIEQVSIGANPLNIRVVNMSLAGGGFFSQVNCDLANPGYRMAIESAWNANIPVFAASGNGCYKDRIASPACVSRAISVGSVYDADVGGSTRTCQGAVVPPELFDCTVFTSQADQVVCNSNSADFLDLLAPGCSIVSSIPPGATDSGAKCGTSMATPHAAGLAALMIGSDGALTPTRLLTVMKETGSNILDAANGVLTPRIRALQAVQAVDRIDQVTCTENCRQDCDTGYFYNGSACAPLCGDGKIVDGEQCDRGGVCTGGTNPGAICLVGQAPSSCLGGGVCNPLTGFGCGVGSAPVQCLCSASNTCGDRNRCGGEECDAGKHCNAGSNFNADCTGTPSICTAGTGACVNGDWVKLCTGASTNRGADCSSNPAICTGGPCTLLPGYCTSTCTVNQAQP